MHVRCHVCGRSYVAVEMDGDPSAVDEAICAEHAQLNPAFVRADAAGSAPRNASCSGHGQPRQPLLVGGCEAHLPGRRCCRERRSPAAPPTRSAPPVTDRARRGNTGSCPSALAADHPTEVGAASQPRACAQTTGGPTPEPAGRDARGRITPAISRWRSVRVVHRPALRPGKESALPWSDSCRRCGDPAIASYRARLWLGRRWAAESVNTASTTLRGRDEQHQQRGSERSVRPAGAIPICRRRARTRCAEGRAHSYRLRPRRCRSGRRSGCFARAVDGCGRRSRTSHPGGRCRHRAAVSCRVGIAPRNADAPCRSVPLLIMAAPLPSGSWSVPRPRRACRLASRTGSTCSRLPSDRRVLVHPSRHGRRSASWAPRSACSARL